MRENVTNKQLRSFAFLVGAVFAVLGFWPLVFRGQHLRQWALLLAGLLIVPGVVWPAALKPVYRIWMAVGHALGWVNTRIILAVIFFLVFTPFGIVMRLFRKDSMLRKLEPEAGSYRVRRHPRDESHMRRQF